MINSHRRWKFGLLLFQWLLTFEESWFINLLFYIDIGIFKYFPTKRTSLIPLYDPNHTHTHLHNYVSSKEDHGIGNCKHFPETQKISVRIFFHCQKRFFIFRFTYLDLCIYEWLGCSGEQLDLEIQRTHSSSQAYARRMPFGICIFQLSTNECN